MADGRGASPVLAGHRALSLCNADDRDRRLRNRQEPRRFRRRRTRRRRPGDHAVSPNSPGDGRGHGTFVAGIAAGSGANYAGAAPAAKLVSLDVMDDNGMARTERRDRRGLSGSTSTRTSTTSASRTSRCTPRFRATSRRIRWIGRSRSSGSAVWTVVAAAGNYGHPRRPERCPVRPRQRSVRDHRRRGPPGRQRPCLGTTTSRTGRPTATRTTASGSRRSPLPAATGRPDPSRTRPCSLRSPRTRSVPATCACRGRPSRLPSSPAQRAGTRPGTRAGRRIR